jgi:hypothetical protein
VNVLHFAVLDLTEGLYSVFVSVIFEHKTCIDCGSNFKPYRCPFLEFVVAVLVAWIYIYIYTKLLRSF